MNTYDKSRPPLYQLEEIASILRSETGCPWDKEQTHKSLKASLIEEAYELYDAIDKEDTKNLREELGDLLYQIYAHAQMEAEQNRFSIDDVALGIVKKLVNRHPHVFGDARARDSDEVLRNWEAIKKKEKTERKSVMDGVPSHLPALQRAFRVQEKAGRVGFDWPSWKDAICKLDEEIVEFKNALTNDSIEEEAGDILFSIVNILRLKGIDAEDALRRSVEKFCRRFAYMEQAVADMNAENSEKLEALWEKAKKALG